jgi:hypothetical protein
LVIGFHLPLAHRYVLSCTNKRTRGQTLSRAPINA